MNQEARSDATKPDCERPPWHPDCYWPNCKCGQKSSAATAGGPAPRGSSIDGRPLEDRTAATALSRLSIARSKALAGVQTVWQGDRLMVGDFTGAKVVAYHVGAAEWGELMDAVEGAACLTNGRRGRCRVLNEQPAASAFPIFGVVVWLHRLRIEIRLRPRHHRRRWGMERLNG